MVVPRTIEPGRVEKARGVHDQRFPLPMPVRPPHPTIGGSLLVVVHIDGANGARKFVQDHDVLLALDDLEGVRHVRRARHPRQIALDFGIQRQPVSSVLLLFCQRLGLVRKLAPFNDAHSARHRIAGAQLPDQPRRRRMGLDVPIGRVERLPDPVQIGLAVPGAGGPIRRSLTADRRNGQAQSGHHRHADRLVAHDPRAQPRLSLRAEACQGACRPGLTQP